MAVSRLSEGMRLTAPVYDASGRRILLQQGAVVTWDALDYLRNNRIERVCYSGSLPMRKAWTDLEQREDIKDARRESRASVRTLTAKIDHLVAERPFLDPRVGELARAASSGVIDQLLLSTTATQHLADLSVTDDYTHEHSVRVGAIALLVAAQHWLQHGVETPAGRMQPLSRHGIELGVGLILHDVGKLRTPKQILLKPGKLTEHEYGIIQLHPEQGRAMVGDFIAPRAADVVLHHHEHYDGSGYPERLRGQEIPEVARIAAIADVFDAIVSDRPYKAGVPLGKTLQIIGSEVGVMFDPSIARSFFQVMAARSTDPRQIQGL